LIYIDPDEPSLFDLYDLPDEALNRLTPDRIRPPRETLDRINAKMF